MSVDAYENDYLWDKQKYTTEEFTGIKTKKRGLARFLREEKQNKNKTELHKSESSTLM